MADPQTPAPPPAAPAPRGKKYRVKEGAKFYATNGGKLTRVNGGDTVTLTARQAESFKDLIEAV